MAHDTPRIDPRGPAELTAQAEALTEQLTPWRRSPPERLDAVGALLRVFARMAGHAVQAINRAPDVGHLAFLELVGVQPRPPQVARAPLTFALAEGAVEASVPARTQVGAEDDDDVVFETEAPLVVTDARLEHVLVRDPDQDRYADLAELVDPTRGAARPLLVGDLPVGHALHVGCGPVLALPGLTEVVLRLDFAAALADPASLRALPLAWSCWDGEAWRRATPTVTASAAGGRHRLQVTFAPAPPAAPGEVDGRVDLWLRAELVTAGLRQWWRDHVLRQDGPAIAPAAMLATIPALLAADVQGRIVLPARPPRAVLAGREPLDPSRDLFPFGEQPRFGDVLHLDPGDLAALPAGAAVTVAVTTCPTPPSPCAPAPALRLAWEVHTAAGWVRVGESAPGTQGSSAPGAGFVDGTAALAASGAVRFTTPAPLVPADEPAGALLRVRIVAGDYGRPATVDAAQNPPRSLPSTLGPPVLRGLTLELRHDGAARPPTALVTVDDHVAVDRLPALLGGAPAPLASRCADAAPTLYLGFSRSLGQVPWSMYIGTCPLEPEDAERPAPPAPPRLAWEYRTAAGWRPLTVDDETRGLVAPGLVRWSVPPDHAAAPEFGRRCHWVRARRTAGAHRGPPRADRIVPHSVWARHAGSARETLGAGDGASALTLRTRQRPVLAGESLEIRERVGLGPEEAAAAAAAVGPDAAARDEGAFGHAVWVRWREVPDFRGSGPDDRHYVLDRAAGLVRFGDGVRGRAVPLGQANVRLTYETGGGQAGNRGARTLTALKASLASVAGVTNYAAGTGGADAEDRAAMAARGAATLRHQGRAVATRDLEDLALAASPEVARALAVPPRADPIAIAVALDADEAPAPGQRVRLTAIPEATADAAVHAGELRVVVVARGQEARPAPSAGLLEHVAAHLRARCPTGMRVTVTGPHWVEVRVTCGLVATSQSHAPGLVAAARAALDGFLHPLTGGLDGQGWPFGRIPRRSDVNRVLAAVPGVDHLRGLEVVCTPPPPPPSDDLSDDELAALARLMAFPGPHALTLVGVAEEVGR
jgi:predicted phage baseplate assembly protein